MVTEPGPLGFTEPNEAGHRYRHGTLSAYNAGPCRSAGIRGLPCEAPCGGWRLGVGGGRAHSIGVREQCAEQSWHLVSVVLLQGVPRHAAFRHWFQLARVWAQWMPPGESMRAAAVWLAACETAWKSAGPHWTTRSLAGADSCPFAACGPWKSPFSGSWRGTVGRVRSGAGLAGNMAGRCCREGVRTVPGCRGSAFPAARLPEGVTGLPGSVTIADGCSR